MSFENLTDAEINRLITIAKQAINPTQAKIKHRSQTQHEELVIHLKTADDGIFTFYTRQNLKMKLDFSCGLTWNGPTGDLTLLRLNGRGHDHPPLGVVFHIHKASERAIKESRKPEAYAEMTKAYDSLEGAKHLLVNMAHISGIAAPAQHPQLPL